MGQVRNRCAIVFALALVLGLAPQTRALENGVSLIPKPRPVQASEITIEDPDIEDVEVVASENATTPDAGVLVSKIPRPRPEGLLNGQEFRFALNAASRGEWDQAAALAIKGGPVAASVIEWQRLRAGRGTFADYQAFLAQNGDWPGLKLLRKRGETSILRSSPAAQVIAYFKDQPPQTANGALRLVDAYAAQGRFSDSRKVLIKTWRTMDMDALEEASFLASHSEALGPHHMARLEDALWRNDRPTARRMLVYADADQKALAEARLALLGRAGNADKLWKAVPSRFANDAGLAHARMDWLVAKKRRKDAATLIIAQSSSADSLGRPEAWAKWRRILARQEMRNGNTNRAYQLASKNFMDAGSDYADLEWLAGYLALRYRNEPAQALTHFRRFRAQIFTPISLGRAGYWEGRALAKMGETNAAEAAFRDAAKYQTSFYGLLAAERIGAPMDPALTGRGDPGAWQSAEFAKSTVFAAANLFHGVDQQWEVTRFLRHLSETTDKNELVTLGNYANSLGDPYISVRVSKQIAREGAVAHRAYYPLTNLGPETLPVAEELALAIARRESEFFVAAKSGVGARGLMQLMPGTAKDMAQKVGLPYDLARLSRDPVYNATLGSAYLAHLEEEFGNNIVLISVGYNAGPHRARTWSKDRGDPRSNSVDVIDWIEHIPFDETRNYVMRVAESLPVYRARLTGKVQPIQLLKELKAR